VASSAVFEDAKQEEEGVDVVKNWFERMLEKMSRDIPEVPKGTIELSMKMAVPDIEIKPGLELDRAVAEVVGVPMPPWASEPWSPSTDLNAAFAAAEKVGLLADDRVLFRHRNPDHWVIWGDYDGSEFARGTTPALAICAAILKLKEETQ
jgi:hypothetical protein